MGEPMTPMDTRVLNALLRAWAIEVRGTSRWNLSRSEKPDRDVLFRWASEKSDDSLLRLRNFSFGSLAWLRKQPVVGPVYLRWA